MDLLGTHLLSNLYIGPLHNYVTQKITAFDLPTHTVTLDHVFLYQRTQYTPFYPRVTLFTVHEIGLGVSKDTSKR